MEWKDKHGHPDFAAEDTARIPFYELVAPQVHVGHAVASALWRAYEGASRTADAVWRWYAARQTERELSRLDDATLKDIGISRGEIPLVSRLSAADPYFTHRDLPR